MTINRIVPAARRALSLLLIVATLAAASTSCRSSRQASSSKSTETVEQKQLANRFNTVVDRTGQLSASWQRIKVPVKVGGGGLPLSGYAYFEKNRSVYVSLRFLGAEVAFASFTADSVIVVDKAHGRYLAESLTALQSSVPVDISNVTDLLLGEPFILGATGLKASDARHLTFAVTDATAWSVSPAAVRNCTYRFEFSSADELTSTIAEAGSRSVTAAYSNRWQSGRDLPFAQRIDLTISGSDGGNAFSANLRYDFNKAQWDGDVTMPTPSIPSGARSMSAQSLLNMLGSM